MWIFPRTQTIVACYELVTFSAWENSLTQNYRIKKRKEYRAKGSLSSTITPIGGNPTHGRLKTVLLHGTQRWLRAWQREGVSNIIYRGSMY